MKKRKPVIVLGPREFIVTAFATTPEGPGWSNYGITVVIQCAHTGKYRDVFLQINEQTTLMISIHGIACNVNTLLVSEAKSLTK